MRGAIAPAGYLRLYLHAHVFGGFAEPLLVFVRRFLDVLRLIAEALTVRFRLRHFRVQEANPLVQAIAGQIHFPDPFLQRLPLFLAQAQYQAIAILLHRADLLMELLMEPAELGVIRASAFGRFGHLAGSRADAIAGLRAQLDVLTLLLGGADAVAFLLLCAFLLTGAGLSAPLTGIRRRPALTGWRSGATAALSSSAPAGALAAALSGCGKCKQR
jgi:hypothetical protein